MTAALAKTVLYRSDEFRFDVDGEPFPYLVAEAGPTFAKRAGFYLVTVPVFPVARANNELLTPILGRHGADVAGLAFEFVDGTRRPFPWATTHVHVTCEPQKVMSIDLTFVAEHVDADIDITADDWPVVEVVR